MNLSDGPSKCLVFECKNTSDLGQFIGDVCMPCHKFITTGKGQHSQVYRNGVNLFIQDMNHQVNEAVNDLTQLLSTLQRK